MELETLDETAALSAYNATLHISSNKTYGRSRKALSRSPSCAPPSPQPKHAHIQPKSRKQQRHPTVHETGSETEPELLEEKSFEETYSSYPPIPSSSTRREKKLTSVPYHFSSSPSNPQPTSSHPHNDGRSQSPESQLPPAIQTLLTTRLAELSSIYAQSLEAAKCKRDKLVTEVSHLKQTLAKLRYESDKYRFRIGMLRGNVIPVDEAVDPGKVVLFSRTPGLRMRQDYHDTVKAEGEGGASDYGEQDGQHVPRGREPAMFCKSRIRAEVLNAGAMDGSDELTPLRYSPLHSNNHLASSPFSPSPTVAGSSKLPTTSLPPSDHPATLPSRPSLSSQQPPSELHSHNKRRRISADTWYSTTSTAIGGGADRSSSLPSSSGSTAVERSLSPVSRPSYLNSPSPAKPPLVRTAAQPQARCARSRSPSRSSHNRSRSRSLERDFSDSEFEYVFEDDRDPYEDWGYGDMDIDVDSASDESEIRRAAADQDATLVDGPENLNGIKMDVKC